MPTYYYVIALLLPSVSQLIKFRHSFCADRFRHYDVIKRTRQKQQKGKTI